METTAKTLYAFKTEVCKGNIYSSFCLFEKITTMKKIALYALLMCGFLPLWAASPYVSRVFEFVPAPGQFVNLLPAYDSGDNTEAMLAKVNDCLVGKANGTVLTLGAWGGYVVVGFDHTIANVADAYDFQINGNAFANNAEPGVVT